MSNRFFFERRQGNDRRQGREQRQNPRLDLAYRRRRSGTERRSLDRSKVEDFYASKPLSAGKTSRPSTPKH